MIQAKVSKPEVVAVLGSGLRCPSTLGVLSLVRNLLHFQFPWQKWCHQKPGYTPWGACAEHPPIPWIPATWGGSLSRWWEADHSAFVLPHLHSDFSQVRTCRGEKHRVPSSGDSHGQVTTVKGGEECGSHPRKDRGMSNLERWTWKELKTAHVGFERRG